MVVCRTAVLLLAFALVRFCVAAAANDSHSRPDAPDGMALADALGAYTVTYRALNHPSGFAYAADSVLSRLTVLSMQSKGLSDTDIEIIQSTDVGNETLAEGLKTFTLVMEAELGSLAVDAQKLGHLLNQAVRRRDEIRGSVYRSMLAELSAPGREVLVGLIAAQTLHLTYDLLDYRGIAEASPDFVIDQARRMAVFIDNSGDPSEALYCPLVDYR